MDYFRGEDEFDTTFEKAMDEIDFSWRNYGGVVVLGSHAQANIEEKLDKIKLARENNVPYLGICHGMQLMVLEFARNVLGIKDANSEEFGPKGYGTLAIVKMPNVRVGLQPVYWKDGLTSLESHWHNYRVANEIIPKLKEHFRVSVSDGVVETLYLLKHKHFIGTQFHPEYGSSREKPHPVLKNFIEICKK